MATTTTKYETFTEYLRADHDANEVAKALREAILDLGSGITRDVQKSQERFSVNRAFAWITSTRMYGTNFPEGWILLTIYVGHSLTGARLKLFDSTSSKVHAYHVDVQSVDDIDDELLGWLEEAYEFGSGERCTA